VSVVIPSRHERWLQATIDDVLAHAAGDVEVIAVLDGCWASPPLKDDPRVVVLHPGQQIGMRDGINAAARIASGEFLLKSDGHCSFSQGFDEVLKADCDDATVIVPRRYSLDVETWTLKPDRPFVDANFLSYPFERPGDITCGLHGEVWRQRSKERQHILFDEEMSSQGSCYFLSKAYWDRSIGPLDTASYGTFASEFQEVGCRAWLGGGRVMVSRKTWYGHLHKGKQYGTGYKYTNAEWKAWAANTKKGHDHAVRFWLLDLWRERKHDFRWLLERFWPVPTWPDDLDVAFRQAREVFK